MLRFLFKLPRHRRFDYQPRFYDERKEALHMRIEAAKQELRQPGDPGVYNPDALRGRLRHAWTNNTHRSDVRRANRNVFLIAALLFLIAYIVFYT